MATVAPTGFCDTLHGGGHVVIALGLFGQLGPLHQLVLVGGHLCGRGVACVKAWPTARNEIIGEKALGPEPIPVKYMSVHQ